MSITSSAVLVELNISVWTANKMAKDATTDLLSRNGATVADAAQVRKNLMAGTNARKAIADYAASCRKWHTIRTLPWSDMGPRLMPTSLFMDYKQELNMRRDTFMRMKDDFGRDYPTLMQTAQNYLGALYSADDYPSVEEVMDKFDFRVVFSPVPEAGDFRLDIPQQELDLVKQEYEANFASRLDDAMRTPWEQLHKMLTGMSSKLTESDEETKRRWHDTFLTNAHEMCAMLTHLNVAKDPKLEAARRQLESALVGADIDNIKEDAITRADLKAKLDAVLTGYEW